MNVIVVGVDGSKHGAAALQWAFREASLRSCDLTATMTWDYLHQVGADGSSLFDPDYDEAAAQEVLDGVVVSVLGEAAAGSVRRHVVLDRPVRGLLEDSSQASLLVLGARGLGGFKGLLLGSVSQRCLREATTSVAIIRAIARTTTDHSRIVVGVDGSLHADAALRWAAREAELRGAALRIVHASQPTYTDLPLLDSMSVGEWAHQQATEVIDDAIARAGIEASTPMQRVCATGSPARALLDACDDSDLLVVGRAGLGGLRRLIGSAAVQLSHHSPVPVVFVSADDAHD